jgi:hypothetical protein
MACIVTRIITYIEKVYPILFLTLDASNIEHWSIHNVSHLDTYLFDEIKHSQPQL